MDKSVRLPSIKELDNAIKSWENIKWNELSLKETDNIIKQITYELIKLYGFFPRLHNFSNTEVLNVPLHNFRKVYRIRTYDENINEDLISEFSNLPVSLSKNLGRANFPYYPVFYGSPHNGTSLIEALETNDKKFDPSKENFYLLSKWVFKEFIPLNIMWFTFGKYNSQSDLSLFSKHYIKDFEQELAATTEQEKELLSSILESMSTLFAQNEINVFAACMAHIHLYHNSLLRTEIFIYPSIRADKTALNYAIHPNTVLHKMYLQKVFQFKIIGYEKKGLGKVEYKIGRAEKCGINDDNGHLTWDKLSETDEKEFETLFPPKRD